MSDELPTYILDSFAGLAFLEGESSAPRIQAIFETAERQEAHVYLSLINLGEILYITERERGLILAQKTLAAIEQLPLEILPATRDRVLAAAHLKTHYPISYADAFVVGAAQEFQGVILTGDPEFTKVTHLVNIEWLASK